MRTFQSYQQEDFENHGDPFAAPWDDEPEPPKPVKGDATEKQISFLIKLMDERNRPYTQDLLDKLSKRDASALISTLLDEPKQRPATGSRRPTAARVEIEPGLYQTPEGEIFKVQIAVHGSGKPYAKRLVLDQDPDTMVTYAEFQYASGAIMKLRPEYKMTAEQAKQFGSLYGMCCNCAKTLTDENSQYNGYGLKCAGNMGWPYEKAPKIKLS